MSSNHHPEDRKAAFTGLVVGVVALVVLVTGIVKLTNARIDAREKPAAHASQ